MDDMECVKVDYKEFEEMTIQHSKDLLQEGELRVTSEIGRNELALNSLSRAEVERGVLYHAQAVLEDMSAIKGSEGKEYPIVIPKIADLCTSNMRFVYKY